MEELLKFIAQSIVTWPKKVKVEKEDLGEMVNLRLQVEPEDLKIIIGKKGRTIRAIRTLLRLKGIKKKKRVNLQILEEKTEEK